MCCNCVGQDFLFWKFEKHYRSWLLSNYENLIQQDKFTFVSFIKDVDIGLDLCDNHPRNTKFYKVLDEKKWIIAKIKYGY